MNIEDIKEDLIKTCEQAIALGWTLVNNETFSSKHKTCCALGAHTAINEMFLFSFYEIAKRKYGMSVFQTSHFVNGFDDIVSPDDINNEYFQLGQYLREKFSVK